VASVPARTEQLGEVIRLGIGLNTGPVIAGTMGGGGRHEFTVIGDTVTIVARCEQLTKETGSTIFVTEAPINALTRTPPTSTNRGAFDLKGKSAAVTLHALDPNSR
jgi:adenylate cyclase